MLAAVDINSFENVQQNKKAEFPRFTVLPAAMTLSSNVKSTAGHQTLQINVLGEVITTGKMRNMFFNKDKTKEVIMTVPMPVQSET